jgi:hypothetical protein
VHARPREQRVYDRTDHADQLRKVMSATFSTTPIMRKGEYGVFKLAEIEARSRGTRYRVFAQTALGEVIESADRDAHAAINSKRVDVLIIGHTGLPLVAIEYQGAGHHQNNAAARDAVKREALRKAGVAFLEIMDFHTVEQIRRLLAETLDRIEQTRT